MYHNIKLKKAIEPSGDAIKEYNELFPKLIKTVSDWWNLYPTDAKTGWQVEIDPTNGIIINSPGEKIQNPIIIPANLDDSFSIGWEHADNRSLRDPKEDIAEELIVIVLNSKFLRLFVDNNENVFNSAESLSRSPLRDKVYEDYGDTEDYYPDEREEFTPYSGHYFTGDGDYVYCCQGEEPDYTACSSDGCGYCGRCRY